MSNEHEDFDAAMVLSPPGVANVYKINPKCGRCSAPSVCAIASIGEPDPDDPMRISLLTLCDPCAQKVVATLDITHDKIGNTWVLKGSLEGPEMIC